MPLTDIVELQSADLEAFASSEDPYSLGKWYQAKRVGLVELAQLGEVLELGDYTDMLGEFKEAIEPSEEGPWLMTIPDSLVSAIEGMSDEQISAVVVDWAEMVDMMEEADLAAYLRELREFIASSKGPFFLCLSL